MSSSRIGHCTRLVSILSGHAAFILRQRPPAHRPDVDRSAAGRARRDEDVARRRAGRHARVAGADDHRAEHRPRRRRRRRDLPGHRHADLRGARRRSAPIRSGCGSRFARRSPKRRGAASCGRTRSTRSPARTPATTSGPGTPIIHFDQWERDDDRDQADPQGRRLREHERAIRAAGRTRRISAAPIARSTASGSASCTRCGTRRARAAAPAPSASASAAIAPRATCTRRSSCSGRSTTSTRIRGWRSSKRRSWRSVNNLEIGAMGFGGTRHAHRLQDRRAQPAARRASSSRSPTTAGRSGVSASCSTRRRGAIDAAGSIAIRRTRSSRCSIRPASRAPAAKSPLQAPLSDDDVRSLKVGDVVHGVGPRCSPAATRCIRT